MLPRTLTWRTTCCICILLGLPPLPSFFPLSCATFSHRKTEHQAVLKIFLRLDTSVHHSCIIWSSRNVICFCLHVCSKININNRRMRKHSTKIRWTAPKDSVCTYVWRTEIGITNTYVVVLTICVQAKHRIFPLTVDRKPTNEFSGCA